MRLRFRTTKRQLLLVAGCGVLLLAAANGVTAASPLSVYTVNYPLAYFAERIGGDHIRVIFPASPDTDPAYWVPDIQTIAQYQQADLILLNGAGYAKWVETVSLPRSKLVNTTRQFKERYIAIEGAVTHSHGPEGDHDHRGVAFTTWLDFDLAALQAGAVKKALARKRPELKDIFEANFASLEKELKRLDADLLQIVSTHPALPLIGSHPVYDYLSDRYGLNLRNLHWEPDQIPGENQWAELQAISRQHPAKWMVWEGAPLGEVVERLNSMGISSLVFDPCAGRPEQGDFMTVMHQNRDALKNAFKK